MNKRTCDKRKRAGFTLAELLMVIAIIGVLVVAAIPGVITLRGNLKMMELDSAARTIYIAAQNRMSELRVSGQMSMLQGVSMGTNAPSDFPADVLDWDNGEYRYLSQDETGALLPEGAIDSALYNGDFYIEYNAKTGMVYSVFYAEEPFTYQLDLPRANKSERRANAPMLGYYGGSDVDYGKFDDSLTPDIELENSDVLALRIRYNSVLDVDYLVTIEDDEHNVAVFDLTDYFSNPNISYSIEGANAVYTVLLDSMTVGLQLKDIFPEGSGQYLVPGNNLKITVTATTGSDYPSSVSVATNSLFAVRDESDVTLSSARHLQNLELSFSGLAADAGIANAAQIGDITWPNENDSPTFVSIARAELNTFNGNGNRITSLNATLFASLNGSLGATKTVENVRLVAPEVRAANLDNVGTLVNEARYAEFRNCVVYAEGRTGHLSSDGAENTGGMVGLATDCTFEQCSASLIAITATGATSGSGVGGFAGKLDGGSIAKSYGNTGYWQTDSGWDGTSGIIANGGYAGGLVGIADGARIENAYAAGNIRLASGSAAGFAGVSRNTPRYTSSYSITSFEGTAASVSPVGFAAGGTQNNCYFLKTTVSGSAADAAGASTDSELKTRMSGNSAFTAANETATTPYGRTNEIYPFSRLSGMVHYGDWLDEEEESEMGNKLYYYELYSDGSYGYYGYAINTLRSDLAVREDGYVFMVQSGNSGAIKIECRAYPFTSGININYNQPVSLNFGGYTYKACFLRPNETLMNYATTNTTTNQVVQISFTDKELFTYYFNPNFAKTVSTSSTPSSEYIVRTARHLARLGVLPNYGNLAFVQERDLDFTTYGAGPNRPVLTPIKGNTQFKGVYDGKNYRILSGNVNFAGQQNVGLFSYINENALLKNIRFVAASSGAVISGGENTGGLVGLLEGEATVENCYVSGFDIRGTTRVGGLVGRSNKGNIQSSRVESCKVTATGENLGGFIGLVEGSSTVTNSFVSGCEVSGTNNVGGFVGSITNGTITNCGAANGYFKNQETNGGFVKGTGSAVGGFAGNANGGTISNCYAVARLNFSTTSNGFFGTGWGTISDCYSVAVNQSDAFVSFSPAANNSSNVIAYDGDNFSSVVDLFKNNANFAFASAINSHPYASSLQGRNYPFPAFVKNEGAAVHYGNWYMIGQPIGLFYFEQYSNGAYGFYGSYLNEAGKLLNIDTLSDTLAVTKDGYANAVYKGGSNVVTTSPAYTWGTSDTPGEYQNAGSPVSVTLSIDGALKDYDFYLLSDVSSQANSNAQAAFYTQVRIVAGRTVSIHWFNPSFAKTVVTGVSQPAAPGSSTAVPVRTARQLSRLGQLSDYNYWARTYKQERNIDFASYNSPLQTLYRIGSGPGSGAFSGTYDGGYNIITGAEISLSSDNVGLFGYNSGTLRNIIFKSDSNATRSISGQNYVGALVGYNDGIINNCAAAGFHVSGTSGSAITANQIGGFVGYNNGTISNCSAANAQMGNALGGSIAGASQTNVGGFAGQNDGSINYSYAIATIAANGSRTGGFVGYTEYGTIAYCYSVTVNGSNSWITDFRGGSLLGAGGTLTGCTAYNGGNLSGIQSNCTSGRGFGTAGYSYSYGTAGSYPFPAIVKNANGEHVHHGNWRT